jgi:ferredoxin
MMKWDDDAKKMHEMLPVPPMMGPFARLQAEKIARHKGLDRVSADVMRETEKVYVDFMGKEKAEELRAYMDGRGPAPAMEEDLFFEDENALFNIEVCYAKYGENTKEVRGILKDMMPSLKAVMEEENLTQIMADLSPMALHGGSRFNLVMTGCPNCCVSPYLKDFGIILKHRVDITDAECTQCGECLKMCTDGAIHLTEDGPVIDRETCVMCELCARDCPTGTLITGERRFQVVAGGTGARRPKIAIPVEHFATKDRVIQVLRNTITGLRKAKPGETLSVFKPV